VCVCVRPLAEAIEMKEETIKGGLENRILGSTVGAMGSGNTVAAQTPIRAHRGVGFVNRTQDRTGARGVSGVSVVSLCLRKSIAPSHFGVPWSVCVSYPVPPPMRGSGKNTEQAGARSRWILVPKRPTT
jgi:hypothetical protein